MKRIYHKRLTMHERKQTGGKKPACVKLVEQVARQRWTSGEVMMTADVEQQ
jgi:hypothetical protein